MKRREPDIPPVRESGKTYQQGYDEGYQKGKTDGYKNGVNESENDYRKKAEQDKAKIKKFVLLFCGIAFLFGAALSGMICGKISYSSGYSTGVEQNQKENEELLEQKGKTEYSRGYDEGMNNAMLTFDEDKQAEYKKGYEEGEAEARKTYEEDMQAEYKRGYDQGFDDCRKKINNLLQDDTESATVQTNEEKDGTEILFSRKINNGTKENPSSQIKKIQERLKELGYLKDTADGIIGIKTEAAIKAFQKANKLEETGEINRNTYDMILGKMTETEQDKADTETGTSDLNSSSETISPSTTVPVTTTPGISSPTPEPTNSFFPVDNTELSTPRKTGSDRNL